MRKFMPMSKEQVAELPAETQKEIAEVLKAFDEVNVTYEYGKYHVSTSIAILARYAPDHKFIGTVYVEDFYTLEERCKNFFEEFGYHSYFLETELKKQRGNV